MITFEHDKDPKKIRVLMILLHNKY